MPIYHNGYINTIRALGFEIAEVYYGRALVFSKDTDFGNDFFESVAGEYDFELTATGDYKIVIRGAGGASGSKSDTHNGGAGGKGQLSEVIYRGTKGEILHINIGEYGLTYNNGGNGGVSLYNSGNEYLSGGNGGGGAEPTFITSDNELITYALGGGGGGGAGRSGYYGGRYQNGSSGGGGGGYYRFNTETFEIENVPGQNGPAGAGRGGGASRGITGNTVDFPTISSGAGQTGNANGGGASGGAGNDGGNHTHSTGGAGGAGAGGDLDAGGGGNGATNHHITPTNTFVENWEHNVVGDYGTGGAGGVVDGENGSYGFVSITYMGHHKVKETIDCMQIDESVDTEIDCEEITKKPDYRNDWGVLFETQPRRRLPEGYQELNYIESTGTQYIDTGVIPNPATDVEITAESIESTSATRYLFGVENGSARYLISVGASTGVYMFTSGNPNSNRIVSSVNPYTNPRRHIHKIVDGKYYIDDTLQGELTIATLQNAPSAWIFAASNATTVPAGNRSKWRVYACTITQNNELVRDMIPAEHMEDGKVGMFDIANNVFYTNAGTDEFIAGAIVYDYGTLGETTDTEDYGDVFILADIDKTINTGEI